MDTDKNKSEISEKTENILAKLVNSMENPFNKVSISGKDISCHVTIKTKEDFVLIDSVIKRIKKLYEENNFYKDYEPIPTSEEKK